MEAAKLGFFYSKLLSKENMRTVVVATLNTMLDNEVQYSSHLLDDIFAELDKNYNFMLGPAILALASTSQLRQIANKDYPFLTEYKHQIKDCLGDPKCATFSQLDFLTGKKVDPENFINIHGVIKMENYFLLIFVALSRSKP